MNTIARFMVLLALGIMASHPALAQTPGKFGTYVGVMKHSKVEKDQFAKLDFIMSRDNSNSFELMAVLSLYFGDFGSKEYVAYHFDNVKYNLITGTLIFDQSDQDLTLITTSFGDGKFAAKLRSSVAGDVGTIELEQDGRALPTRDYIRSVEGKYEGFCEGEPTTLQLNTYKSSGDISRLGNPFGSFQISGQVGDFVTFGCEVTDGRQCTTDIVYSGSYDYFNGQLNLFGKRNSYDCQIDGDSLTCGACGFKKTIAYSDSGVINRPLTSVNKAVTNSPINDGDLVDAVPSISGEYKGYLHHERLDQYQSASMNIVAYQDPGNGQGLKMSAVANLFFGDFTSPERLPYRFSIRNYNLLGQVFVFEDTDADVDAVLQVTDIGNGVVRGVWYSILFGRVGTFEFTKGEVTALPAGAKQFKRLTGTYESPTFVTEVATMLDRSPGNAENPFYPQVFSGLFWYKSGISRRINITGGSYDFYTGKIAFDIRDGERVAVGENNSNDLTMYLKWPPRIITPPLPNYEFETFRQ